MQNSSPILRWKFLARKGAKFIANFSLLARKCAKFIAKLLTWRLTNQFGERNERLPDLCFSICRFSQVVFIPQAKPHAQSLFLFPIVFGINLIHFFDFFDEKEERCSRKFDRLLCCSDPLSFTPFDSAKNANCFERCNVFGSGKCELSTIQARGGGGGVDWGANFLAKKSAKLFANAKVHVFGKEKCKTHRQFQRDNGDVTSVSLSLSLSLSLSVSLSLSHRVYLTQGSASALPIIKEALPRFL